MFAHWQNDFKQVDNPLPGNITTSGSPTFVTTTKKFGTHSLQCNTNSLTDYDVVEITRDDNYTGIAWTIEFWLNVAQIGWARSDVIRFNNNIGFSRSDGPFAYSYDRLMFIIKSYNFFLLWS